MRARTHTATRHTREQAFSRVANRNKIDIESSPSHTHTQRRDTNHRLLPAQPTRLEAMRAALVAVVDELVFKFIKETNERT